LKMDDDGAYLRHIHLINGRRLGLGHWLRVMRPAAEYVGSSDDNKVFLPPMRKPRSKLAKTAAFTRAAVALPVAEALDPDTSLILSIERRSSSCADPL
jgi:hypothetical protein